MEMDWNSLSEYACTFIGLDLTNDQVLALLNHQNAEKLKQIFLNIDDCEQFLKKQNEGEVIVLIVSSYVLTDRLVQLQAYRQLDAIYSYTKSDDVDGELICIYRRSMEEKIKEIVLAFMKHWWLIIGLIIVLIIAYLLPNLGASNGPLCTKYTVKWGCVFIIFLLDSLSWSFKDLSYDLFNYRLHLTTQIYSLVFIPWIVFGAGLLLVCFSINKYLIIGWIATGCMPTGNRINIISTKYAGGNERGTLFNISLGSILGIFISPITVGLFMSISDLATVTDSFSMHYYLCMVGILSLTILLPIIIGQIIKYRWAEKFRSIKTADIIDVFNLVLIWTVLCDIYQSDLSKTLYISDFLILIIFNGLLILCFTSFAFFLAQLPDVFICRKRETTNVHQPLLHNTRSNSSGLIQRWRFTRANTITFMFCSSTKTITSSILLIASVFSDYDNGVIALMTLPVIFYHIEQWILCLIEVILLKRYFTHDRV